MPTPAGKVQVTLLTSRDVIGHALLPIVTDDTVMILNKKENKIKEYERS